MGPRIVPGVLGDHPAEAIVNGCSAGAIIRALAIPRVHECAIVHGSRCTFTSPYFFICSAVHSLAFLSCGDPVSRAPILSERYSRFCMASLCSRTSFKICAIVLRRPRESTQRQNSRQRHYAQPHRRSIEAHPHPHFWSAAVSRRFSDTSPHHRVIHIRIALKTGTTSSTYATAVCVSLSFFGPSPDAAPALGVRQPRRFSVSAPAGKRDKNDCSCRPQ